MPEPGEGRGGPPWAGRHGGGRPPWWPEGEQWSDGGRAEWRRKRRWLFGIVIGLLLLIVALLLGGGFLINYLLAGHPRLGGAGLLIVVLLLLLVVRGVRGAVGPVGDVMAAADRVAGGDYTVRVTPRGPGRTRRLASSFNEMTERLARTERQRRDLLADVAHELRTPLAVVRGNLEGMLDGIYPSDAAHLRPVLDQTDAMAQLLDDLQTLSTAEAGQLRLHREPTDLAALATDQVAAFEPQASSRGVTLRMDLDPELPTEMELDPLRIGEVLRNLLANAVRHTPASGTVTVGAHRASGVVQLSVTDTGPGIPAADLPHVFERFVRSADSGGHGLGLAIAKALVEAHGGSVEASSPARGGAEFRVQLPLA
jgi:two-component system sensor histidine kinase BaeS